jgi:hypothetical protein
MPNFNAGCQQQQHNTRIAKYFFLEAFIFCSGLFIFPLYFHYSVFLLSFLYFYSTAPVPVDRGPPLWS